ncbi:MULTISPECIES: LrgB family protein [Persicobacter]|uniref:Membrane protein n=1 Tax=Persicobacter diffluens TaxID=981 RepID=A0AAN5AJV6_9BACT|nr:LrgB family protein [Persicobacter sp. CCB-QB2]GJM61419.1 membrane protein [Persicobacter diffluens]
MDELYAVLNTKIFSITFTCLVYLLSQKLYARSRNFFLFHPVLLSIAVLIAYLKISGVSYETYKEGGDYISFFLGPAVVALGVPLYLQIEEIRAQKGPILISLIIGCIIGILSGVFFAFLFGGTKEVIFSIAPKSVTTPIAMGISGSIGGIPSLTAIIVVLVGIFGGIVGVPILKALKITNPKAMGLGMGACAHGVGTAAVSEEGQVHAAYGGLALGLCGVITAILTPLFMNVVWPLMEMWK